MPALSILVVKGLARPRIAAQDTVCQGGIDDCGPQAASGRDPQHAVPSEPMPDWANESLSTGFI